MFGLAQLLFTLSRPSWFPWNHDSSFRAQIWGRCQPTLSAVWLPKIQKMKIHFFFENNHFWTQTKSAPCLVPLSFRSKRAVFVRPCCKWTRDNPNHDYSRFPIKWDLGSKISLESLQNEIFLLNEPFFEKILANFCILFSVKWDFGLNPLLSRTKWDPILSGIYCILISMQINRLFSVKKY